MGATTIRTLLWACGLGPHPDPGGPGWSQFRRPGSGIMAGDCFTVATVGLKTLSVLCCIQVGTRSVRLAGVTTGPDCAWVTQPGRKLAIDLDAQQAVAKFLIGDRDAKLSGPFDQVLRTKPIRVLRPPVQAPKAAAFAQRWVHSVRAECLEGTLVGGCGHLQRLLRTDVDHDNTARPQRGLGLGCRSCRVNRFPPTRPALAP